MTVVPFPGSAADEKPDGKRRRKDGRGDFFAVDRRAWAWVCGSISSPGLGMNAAVAYLALARGTGANNRDTPWSVNALEKRNLMSRGRAGVAITDGSILSSDALVERCVQQNQEPRERLAGIGDCHAIKRGLDRSRLPRAFFSGCAERLTFARGWGGGWR